MLKKRKNPKPKFQIFGVYSCEDSDDDNDLCYYINDAYDLFHKYGIRLSNYENPALIAITEKEDLAGALFGGPLPSELSNVLEIRFSVVIDEKYRRLGIYRNLLKEFLKDCINNYRHYDEYESLVFTAWVINPLVIPVLEENGFESVGREWSPDSPFFEKIVSL